MPTNNDGFPDGTTIVTTPASCPDPGTYVVPTCAHGTEHIYIPLNLDVLATTGSEALWWVVPAAWIVIAIAFALILGAFLRAGRGRDDS